MNPTRLTLSWMIFSAPGCAGSTRPERITPRVAPHHSATPVLRQAAEACAPHAEPGCFYLQHEDGQDCWVPRAELGYAACLEMNGCLASVDGLEGMECYKWSGDSHSSGQDWERAPIWNGEQPTTSGPDGMTFYDDSGCFVYGLWQQEQWIPAPALHRDACQALDACADHGGGLSDGRCYKWARHTAAEPVPWEEEVSSGPPASLQFPRSAVQRDVLLAYAEATYQPVTMLTIIESVRPNGVHGHAVRVLQHFSQGVRFEHIPMDVDANGTVSSALTVPDMTDAQARALMESLAQELDLTGGIRAWQSPHEYVVTGEVGECSLSFSRDDARLTIRLGCASG